MPVPFSDKCSFHYRHSVARGTQGLLLIVARSLPAHLHIDLVASRHEGVTGSIASLFVEMNCGPTKNSFVFSPALSFLFILISQHPMSHRFSMFIRDFQVRKGFWKSPPQIWLGDYSKIRVLDPHFLHQTADRLLRIPLQPKSIQVRDPLTCVCLRIMNHNSGGSPFKNTFPTSTFYRVCSVSSIPPFFPFCSSLLPTWMLTRLNGASTD